LEGLAVKARAQILRLCLPDVPNVCSVRPNEMILIAEMDFFRGTCRSNSHEKEHTTMASIYYRGPLKVAGGFNSITLVLAYSDASALAQGSATASMNLVQVRIPAS